MKYTMVIADDEQLALKSQELFIKKEFPDITILGLASNGIELKQMLEELEPDIAIVDIRMPGLQGIEVIELLRHSNSLKTHYIVNTAYSDFEYIQKALNLRTDGYMLKPGKREEWISTVRQICGMIAEEKQESMKNRLFQDAINVVSPVLGSEILQSIFTEHINEEDFATWCSINNVIFECGCIAVFLPEKKKQLDRKHVNMELETTINSLCKFLATVTEKGVVMMLFVPSGLQKDRQQSWCNELVFLISGKLEEIFHTRWVFGIGGIYGSFPEMKASYRDSIQSFEEKKQNTACLQEENPDKADSYVAKTKQYVDIYFHRDLSLADCAEEVGISPYYLSHIFKERTGQNFIEYLSEKRIREAKKLALDNQLTIKDIAERVGYLNITYFCKVFKRVTGQTIGEYRKEQEKKRK